MVINLKVVKGYRTYEVYWSGNHKDNAEMWLLIGEQRVSEWEGEINAILDTFTFETDIAVSLLNWDYIYVPTEEVK